MAEEKKDSKKDAKSAGAKKDVFAEIVFILFILALVYYFLNFILSYFGYSLTGTGFSRNGGTDGSTIAMRPVFGGGSGSLLHSLFGFIFGTLEVLSVFISFLLILGIIYIIFKKKEKEKFGKAQAAAELQKAETAKVQPQINAKWIRVLQHLDSANASDWRLCILEADILLNDVLNKQGYIGNSIGDKLKTAVRGDFRTLDNAWEAHKIRNAIAHEGADFSLSQNEARRVINMYKSVFEEFFFI